MTITSGLSPGPHKRKTHQPAILTWLWVLSGILGSAQRPRQTLIRVPILDVGRCEMLWDMDVTNYPIYWKARSQDQIAFSISGIEKAVTAPAENEGPQLVEISIRRIKILNCTFGHNSL